MPRHIVCRLLDITLLGPEQAWRFQLFLPLFHESKIGKRLFDRLAHQSNAVLFSPKACARPTRKDRRRREDEDLTNMSLQKPHITLVL